MRLLNLEFKEKKQRILILAILLLLVSMASALFCFCFLDNENLKLHKYAVEIPIEQDDFGKLDTPENGGGAVVGCGIDAEIYLKDKKVEYYYSNPSKSPSAVTLEIFVEDKLVAYSGVIPPGYRTFQLNSEKKIGLMPGDYKGTLKITFYDSQTMEKETVDGKVDIGVIVIK